MHGLNLYGSILRVFSQHFNVEFPGGWISTFYDSLETFALLMM